MHTETPISDVTRQLGADGSVRDPIEVAREKTDRILATHQPEPGMRPCRPSLSASSRRRSERLIKRSPCD